MLNIVGDFRYVSDESFAAFADLDADGDMDVVSASILDDKIASVHEDLDAGLARMAALETGRDEETEAEDTAFVESYLTALEARWQAAKEKLDDYSQRVADQELTVRELRRRLRRCKRAGKRHQELSDKIEANIAEIAILVRKADFTTTTSMPTMAEAAGLLLRAIHRRA